jgi:hypothetical protein
MRFLRSVADYRRVDKKRNIDITQELNIFNLGQKVKENQRKYVEHILIIPTYRVLRKLFDYRSKGRQETGRPPKRWNDQPGDRIRSEGLSLAADDDVHELLNCLPCNFLHYPVTSWLLGPNTPLNTLSSHTFYLCCSLLVRKKVSQPHKTIG